MNKENLRRTFENAKKLNKLKPWEWISDLDIFAIALEGFKDPIFISILGQTEDLSGIVIYSDPIGLSKFFDTLDNLYLMDDVSILHEQQSTALYFLDRDELPHEGYSKIKESGVGFRGKGAWPYFITFKPGYMPRNSEDYIYEFMPDLLEAVIDCCKFFKDNMDKVRLLEYGKYYFRDYRDGKTFSDQIMSYDEYFDNTFIEIDFHQTYDDLDIQRIKRGKRINTTWELGFFYHTNPIADDDNPYFPVIFLIVDLNDQAIIAHHLSHPEDKYPEFQRYLLDVMLEDKVIPSKINVSDDELFENLEELCELLSIELNRVEDLKEFLMAKEAFFDFFSE